MKKLTALTLAGILALAITGSAAARMGGRGHMGDQRFITREDMFARRGMGYGGKGYSLGQGPGYCRNLTEEGDRLTSAEEARTEVERFLTFRQNPNVKAGEVADKGSSYEVDIVTQEGSLANKVLVDKRTGRLFPAYR